MKKSTWSVCDGCRETPQRIGQASRPYHPGTLQPHTPEVTVGEPLRLEPLCLRVTPTHNTSSHLRGARMAPAVGACLARRRRSVLAMAFSLESPAQPNGSRALSGSKQRRNESRRYQSSGSDTDIGWQATTVQGKRHSAARASQGLRTAAQDRAAAGATAAGRPDRRWYR